MNRRGRPSNRDKALNAVIERGREVAASLPDDDKTPLPLANGDACARSTCVSLPVSPVVAFMSHEEVRAIYGRNPETRRYEDGSPILGRRPRSESFNELVHRIWFDDRLLEWVQYVHTLRREWLSWPEAQVKPFPDFIRDRYAMDRRDPAANPVPPKEPEPRLIAVERREEELPGGRRYYSKKTMVPPFTFGQIVAWYERERLGLASKEKRPAEKIAHRILRKFVSRRFDDAGNTLPSISDLRRSSLRRKR